MASRELTARFGQDLLQHPLVGLDFGEPGAVIELQRDVLATDALRHFGHFLDHRVQVQPQLDDLFGG